MHFIYDTLQLLSEPKEAQQEHDKMDSKIKWPKGGKKKFVFVFQNSTSSVSFKLSV